MDTIEELDAMLSRCGSFWYVTLSDIDKKIARTLAQSVCRTRINSQLQQAFNKTRGGGYYRDVFRSIRFRPDQVDWVGTKEALQKRINSLRADQLSLGPGVWLSEDSKVAGDEHGTPILFPDATTGDTVFPGNFQVKWCLVVSPDIMIETIRDEAGRFFYQGVDFISFFGSVWFKENPLKLFPHMVMDVRSLAVRCRNLFSYTLQLNDVYGPADRVLDYYKGHQSVRKFYLAAAQAAGLAVVRGEGIISKIDPLLAGYSYVMRDGTRYDAPYNHTVLKVGQTLPDEYVIGGEELFVVYGPDDVLPTTVDELDLANAFPVKNLIARSTAGATYRTLEGIPYFRPDIYASEGSDALSTAFYEVLAAKDGGPVDTTGMVVVETAENGMIDYVRNTLLKGRCIVVCLNESYMSHAMKIRLHEFLQREVPLGGVLTYAKLDSTIPKEN